MNKTEMTQFLSQKLSFWNNLTSEQKTLLVDSAVERTFEQYSTVHNSLDRCLGIILLKSGQLRVYISGEDGREVTLYRLYGGDICTLSASCVMDAVSFEVMVSAEETCRAVVLSALAYRQLMESNVYVKAYTYELTVQHFADVMWSVEQVLFMGADKRLAIFLNDEIAKTGSNVIQLSHEQIAKYMGTAREVVSRMLKYFASEGIVTLSRREITVIDKKKLRSLM